MNHVPPVPDAPAPGVAPPSPALPPPAPLPVAPPLASPPLGASPPLAAPFLLAMPAQQAAPLVVASPHSGRLYPPEFVAASRLDPVALRRSEDGFVDRLWEAAPALGVPLLAATFPRAWCDANRQAWELDPAMFSEPLPPWVTTASPRLDAGLGTLARVVASGEGIYRDKLPFAEAVRRVREGWQPYHDALAALLAATRARFGACLLLDCHSMPAPAPGPAPGPGGAADVVLGDAYGTACAPAAGRLVEAAFAARGYRVRRNHPYAGGFVTRHYGRPREGVHVLQVELARGLYMDEARVEPSPGFERLRRDVTGVLEELVAALADRPGLLLR